MSAFGINPSNFSEMSNENEWINRLPPKLIRLENSQPEEEVPVEVSEAVKAIREEYKSLIEDAGMV